MSLDRKALKAAALALGLAIALAVAPAVGASAETIGLSPPSLAQAAPGTPVAPAVPAPANDERANAQSIHSLPATINGTTVGATVEPGERESACGMQTASSVWYSLRPSSAQRIATRPGGRRRARRHDRRLPRGALTARVRGLPADGFPRQGLAHVQGLQERSLSDPRGRACKLAAGELLARSVPADPRDRATRARRCPPAESTGRSIASRTSTPPTRSRCARASAT